MAKKVKTGRPKVEPSKKHGELLNLKVTSKDRKVLNALAMKHAGGNLSAWLRHSGLHYRPGKTEVIR